MKANNRNELTKFCAGSPVLWAGSPLSWGWWLELRLCSSICYYPSVDTVLNRLHLMVQRRTQDEPWYRYIVNEKWPRVSLGAERPSQWMRAARNMSAGISFRSTQTKCIQVQGQFTTEPPPRRLGLCGQPSTKNAARATWSKKNDRYKVNKQKERSCKMVLLWPELSGGWVVLSCLSKKTWARDGSEEKDLVDGNTAAFDLDYLGREKVDQSTARRTPNLNHVGKQEVWFTQCATVVRGLLPWLLDGLPARGANIWKGRVKYPSG